MTFEEDIAWLITHHEVALRMTFLKVKYIDTNFCVLATVTELPYSDKLCFPSFLIL